MEAVVIAPGAGLIAGRRPARATRPIVVAALATLAFVAGPGERRAGAQGNPLPKASRAPSQIVLPRDNARPTKPTKLGPRPDPAPTSPPPAPVLPPVSKTTEAPRYQIRNEAGESTVARLHGERNGRALLIQPDGQLGIPSVLVPTKEPFVPIQADELRRRLEDGPYAGFQVLTTPHYLIFYKSRLAFAQDSAKLLEELYRGLLDFCRRHDLPAHDSEFPLVAVIFATERDFRAHKQVDPEVQAYYEIFTNRIFFYDQSERDKNEPRLVTLRKPQTVAHEGTHQILANIGIQPRRAEWPLWLIEGFAEYCATPTRTKKGFVFDRLGAINALHMATLRELDDPLSMGRPDGEKGAEGASHSARLIDSRALVLKEKLTPTDYAQSWALTLYLTQKHPKEFTRYLLVMGRMSPLEPRTPEDHLKEFREYFGQDLDRLDREAEDYLHKLMRRGNFPSIPYYAVIVEQPLGGGMLRRTAWISQSPQMIQRWVEKTVSSGGGIYNWEAVPFPTRARAELYAENWIRGY